MISLWNELFWKMHRSTGLRRGGEAMTRENRKPGRRIHPAKKWRAQGDDFRTFLGEFVSSLQQF